MWSRERGLLERGGVGGFRGSLTPRQTGCCGRESKLGLCFLSGITMRRTTNLGWLLHGRFSPNSSRLSNQRPNSLLVCRLPIDVVEASALHPPPAPLFGSQPHPTPPGKFDETEGSRPSARPHKMAKSPTTLNNTKTSTASVV